MINYGLFFGVNSVKKFSVEVFLAGVIYKKSFVFLTVYPLLSRYSDKASITSSRQHLTKN